MAELSSEIIRLLRRRADPEEHRAIRQLWIDHSVAEDSRNIPGLMATLTEDCVYTIANHNVSWHGKEGATRFYQAWYRNAALFCIATATFNLSNGLAVTWQP